MAARRGNPPVLKRFGQHFLTDQSALAAIAAALEPEPNDTIVEIGPGRGALTDILAAAPNKLIAIEIDHALTAGLRERYASNPRVTIVEADVLTVEIGSLARGPLVVVGNVPYYITTPILFHVMQPPLPRRAVFLVQREVGERIVAKAGSREYGALSVNLQAIATAKIVRQVSRASFRPAPKVDSSVIAITPRLDAIVSPDEIERFRGFVQGLFGMRRKQLANAIRSVFAGSSEQITAALEKVGVDARARAETLTPEMLAELMRAVYGTG